MKKKKTCYKFVYFFWLVYFIFMFFISFTVVVMCCFLFLNKMLNIENEKIQLGVKFFEEMLIIETPLICTDHFCLFFSLINRSIWYIDSYYLVAKRNLQILWTWTNLFFKVIIQICLIIKTFKTAFCFFFFFPSLSLFYILLVNHSAIFSFVLISLFNICLFLFFFSLS